MEQDKKNLLEMIDRPAFLVQDGIIQFANQIAKNRQIQERTPIEEFLTEHLEAYKQFKSGCLYLTLEIGLVNCGATITRQTDGDLFLLERDLDMAQLQALSLAGQQLRMPLANVMTLADSLIDTLPESSTGEQAGQLSRSLHQLLRIISNMADSERYMGLETHNLETTELSVFLREVIEKAQCALDESSVRICYEGLPRAVFTLADRERLERAIFNLISNAVKFSPKDGIVQVKADIVGKQVYISVEDQGCGIAPSVMGSLFSRYQREASIEDSRFGLGLGMTLVRTAAAIHGGTVLVDQPGGTRVTMSIALRKTIPGGLRSPSLRISDYLGGRDNALVELSDALPTTAYKKNP